jgi:hypothetical protein
MSSQKGKRLSGVEKRETVRESIMTRNSADSSHPTLCSMGSTDTPIVGTIPSTTPIRRGMR